MNTVGRETTTGREATTGRETATLGPGATRTWASVVTARERVEAAAVATRKSGARKNALQ